MESLESKERRAMRYVRVVNTTTEAVLAERAELADSMFSRFLGLQGRRNLPAGAGLVLIPSNGIHMFFMFLRIDAVFVAADGTVLRVARGLRPWTLGPIVPAALYCVELPEGVAQSTSVGHTIALHPMAEASHTLRAETQNTPR